MRYRRVAPIVLILIFLVGFLGVIPTRAWTTEMATIIVSDDFYTYEYYASHHIEYDPNSITNVGYNATITRYYSGYSAHTYLLFDLSGKENLTQADLSFWTKLQDSNAANPTHLKIYACNLTNVTVSNITWDNEPTCDLLLGEVDINSLTAQWWNVTLDLTKMYMNNSQVLLRIESTTSDLNRALSIASEESEKPARLLVSYITFEEHTPDLFLDETPLLLSCGTTMNVSGILTSNGTALAGMNVVVDIVEGNNTLVSQTIVTNMNGEFTTSITVPEVELVKTVQLHVHFDGYTDEDAGIYYSPVEITRDMVISCPSSGDSSGGTYPTPDLSGLLELWSLISSSGEYLSDYVPIPVPILTLMVVFIAAGLIISILAKAWKWLLVALFVAFLLGFLGVI